MAKGRVYFVGAGPGDPELVTLKAKRILEAADLVIYAGSLIPPAVLDFAGNGAQLRDSAGMIHEEIVALMIESALKGCRVVRLHSGDPSIFGTMWEQIEELERAGVQYEVVPGVSSVFAASAALKTELTVPELSQTVIFTRIEGRTKMPERESLRDLAAHRSTMAIFLSTQYIDRVVEELLHAFPPETPAAVVQKASWPEEKIVRGTLSDIAPKVKAARIVWTAVIIVGAAVGREPGRPRSRLYDKNFSHGYRQARNNA